MPSSSPIPSICAVEIKAVLFRFHDELLQVFIPRVYYNYRIENRANEEPAILFTLATRKDGIPPPPVRLSWDSRHPPPESVRTDGRMDGRMDVR